MNTPIPKTVLVVDDFAPVCELVEALLCGVGYRVLKAVTGPEALRLARKDRIDLLVSNVALPRMRGDELADRFAEIHPSVPVVFLSSCDQPLKAAREREVLLKPFTMKQLRETVSRALARHPGSRC